MTAKYGSISILRGNRVKCSICGFDYIYYKGIDDYVENKAECPICKATKNLKAKADMFGDEFFVDVNMTQSMLRDDRDITRMPGFLSVQCRKCGAKLLLDLDKLEKFAKNPSCIKCKHSINKKVETRQADSKSNSTGKETRVEQGDKADKQQENVEVENKTIKQDRITKKFPWETGKVYNGRLTIDSLDTKQGIAKAHCIHCGVKIDLHISDIKKRADLVCNNCKTNYGSAFDLAELSKRYIGRAFNGLEIRRVYEDSDNPDITLCDVQCSNCGKELNKVELGSLINGKAFCIKCGEQDVGQNFLLNKYFSCGGYFRNKNSRIGQNNIQGLKQKDLYTKDINLCSLCANENTCKDKDKFDCSSEMVVAKYNQAVTRRNRLKDISSEYPTIYKGNESENQRISKFSKENLLVVREAYVGQDGLSYYFCKCTTHGVELMLNSTEIQLYECQKCFSNRNKYMGFLDIDEDLLISPIT